jgi:hypothetical protein
VTRHSGLTVKPPTRCGITSRFRFCRPLDTAVRTVQSVS